MLDREYYGGPKTPPEVRKPVDRAVHPTLAAGELAMIPVTNGADALAWPSAAPIKERAPLATEIEAVSTGLERVLDLYRRE